MTSYHPQLATTNQPYPATSTKKKKQNYPLSQSPFNQKKTCVSVTCHLSSMVFSLHVFLYVFVSKNKRQNSPATVGANAGGSSKLHPPCVKPPAQVVTHQLEHLAVWQVFPSTGVGWVVPSPERNGNKPRILSMKYWLVNRDPNNGLL